MLEAARDNTCSKKFFYNPAYKDELESMGLTSLDEVFGFSGGEDLVKAGLGSYRERIRFELYGKCIAFLKRYTNVPIKKQLRNWIDHKAVKATGEYDAGSIELAKVGIDIPDVIAVGFEKGLLFEKRSFVITAEVADSKSLEQRLPSFDSFADKKNFIDKLSGFAVRFHETGFCHRDFYLCHIFYDGVDKFTLIDLQRVFKPGLFAKRFKLKDISQLYYSSGAVVFTKADRLRFYKGYKGIGKLTAEDKRYVRKINCKAKKMAIHDAKHGRKAGYAI